MKNYMKDVAKLLKVEFYERFDITDSDYNPYYIDENGVHNCLDYIDENVLLMLLTGEQKIRKRKNILNEKESEYLSSVIKPKQIYERVVYVCKRKDIAGYYISIKLTCSEEISLPYFDDKEMYKNMEIDKMYSIEKLGLLYSIKKLGL